MFCSVCLYECQPVCSVFWLTFVAYTKHMIRVVRALQCFPIQVQVHQTTNSLKSRITFLARRSPSTASSSRSSLKPGQKCILHNCIFFFWNFPVKVWIHNFLAKRKKMKSFCYCIKCIFQLFIACYCIFCIILCF